MSGVAMDSSGSVEGGPSIESVGNGENVKIWKDR
jgi:hypothetical protein